MSRCDLTPQARLDLIEIWNYIAQDNIDMADRVLKEIDKAMDNLVDHPEMGHWREDLVDRRHRLWTLYSYHLIYRTETTPLQVVRILHASRDIAEIL
jgi:plasmid stabilization system protein ParE